MAFTKKKPKRNTKKRFIRTRKCPICHDKTPVFSYKDVAQLSQYVTEKGKIVPRRISGFCAKCQRLLSRVVKRSRHSGLMSFAAHDG